MPKTTKREEQVLVRAEPESFIQLIEKRDRLWDELDDCNTSIADEAHEAGVRPEEFIRVMRHIKGERHVNLETATLVD